MQGAEASLLFHERLRRVFSCTAPLVWTQRRLMSLVLFSQPPLACELGLEARSENQVHTYMTSFQKTQHVAALAFFDTRAPGSSGLLIRFTAVATITGCH